MLRVGLVGAGMVSRHHLLAWGAQSRRARVVAIADPSDAAAAGRAGEFGIPARYPDAAAMLDAEGLDAVDIGSPRETHAAIVEAAVARGVPVLCQKPLAPTLGEAEALVALVAGRARLMVHENWRFRPYYRDMRAWIAEGRIGAPRQALATLLTAGMLPGPEGSRPALTRQPFMRDLDRMLVAEVLIHHLDTLRFLLGPLRVEAATLGRDCPELRGEDRATIAMRGEGGLAAVLLGNMSAHGAAVIPPEPEVVQALQEEIIFGRLPPGTRLVEDALLARFGVSRHYVRQALDRLERLGLAVGERNKGFTVRSLSPVEVEQIYEVRELVQRQAALRIPLPAPPALVEALTAINAELAAHMEARDLRGVHDANDRFHLCLFGACGNAYLLATVQHYMRLSLPVRAKTLADEASLRISHDQHRLMIRMLQGRDNWVLAQLCVDHLQPSKNEYLTRAGLRDTQAA